MYPTESPFKVYTGLDGKPLDRGYVYFGVANQNPITAPVTVYWDVAGTQPAAQPLRTENGYIVRAGTPANVFCAVSYSELVQDSRKRQVFYARTSDDFSIISALLAFISLLASSVGSSLSGFIQAGGLGLVAMTVQSMLRGTIDPRQYGAVLDGITDDTDALQRTINSRGFDKSIAIKFPAGYPTALIEGTLYIPSLCTIDLNGCLLSGDGTNTMFETGYWLAGAVVSNHAQPNETAIVHASAVFNGQITNCDRGFKLFNFCESSRIVDVRFTGTNQAIYAKRCFYAAFERLLARAPLNAATYPCFHFSDAVNAIGMYKMYPNGYTTGWLIDGSKDNFYGTDCGAESCTNGVVINNSSFGMKFSSWYFENVTTALSFSSGGNHENIDVGNCFFNTVTTAITGTTIVSGIFRRTNRLNGALVALSTNFSNQLLVEIPNDTTATNAVAALPAAYAIGDTATVDYVKTIYDTATGLAAVKSRISGGKIPFNYAGDCGTVITGNIPFCVSVLTAISLTIDTKINYRDNAVIMLQLNIADGGTQLIAAIYIGALSMAVVKPAGYTITPTNNAGFFTFTVTGLTAATAFSGVVRIL